MPMIEVMMGSRREYRPKYGNVLLGVTPWRLVKEDDRQWEQLVAENGRVLLTTDGDVPTDVHLWLASMSDVEVVAR
jgi:hypothetical protein